MIRMALRGYLFIVLAGLAAACAAGPIVLALHWQSFEGLIAAVLFAPLPITLVASFAVEHA